MHEMALCEGIRATVDEVARRNGAQRVTVVRLEIGRFAGVEKHALAFAFDVVMRGSVADGARVEMIDLPGRAFCFGCGREVEIDDRLAPCPVCGSGQLVPSGGEEMRIRDMEVL